MTNDQKTTSDTKTKTETATSGSDHKSVVIAAATGLGAGLVLGTVVATAMDNRIYYLRFVGFLAIIATAVVIAAVYRHFFPATPTEDHETTS